MKFCLKIQFSKFCNSENFPEKLNYWNFQFEWKWTFFISSEIIKIYTLLKLQKLMIFWLFEHLQKTNVYWILVSVSLYFPKPRTKACMTAIGKTKTKIKIWSCKLYWLRKNKGLPCNNKISELIINLFNWRLCKFIT